MILMPNQPTNYDSYALFSDGAVCIKTVVGMLIECRVISYISVVMLWQLF